jgi:hypothetical protein
MSMNAGAMILIDAAAVLCCVVLCKCCHTLRAPSMRYVMVSDVM